MRHIVHSRLCRRRMYGWRLSTTGSRTRGYSPFRASRLSDAPTFGNKDNQKGVWKTRTWIAGGFQASGLIMSVYQWRLKDEKLNSRGLSSPWKPRHTPTGNRRKTGIGNMYNAHHPKNYVLLSNLNDSLLKYSFVFSQNLITPLSNFFTFVANHALVSLWTEISPI